MKRAQTVDSTSVLLHFPGDVSRLGPALIDEQMWCWGCDVRHRDGNLLRAYGLVQRPSPEPRFHSAYTEIDAAGRAINLWGWGIWTAAPESGSLFISRDRLKLRWTPIYDAAPQAWTADDLPLPATSVSSGITAAAISLLRWTFLWIAAYERWLVARMGIAYRAGAVDAWPQRRRFRGGIPAEELAAAWARLADALAQPLPE